MLQKTGMVVSIVLAVSMFGCADEPVSSGDSSELLPEPTPSDGQSSSTADETLPAATSSGDTLSAGNGCSIVVWCDEPSSVGPNGTVCRQVACDLPTAQNECSREVAQICGAPVQPFIIICKNASCT